jgi:sugar-specific transcriptional regulator TrmB
MGPVTASALAKELNIDRTKAYRTIDKLLHLKIVSTTFSKPKLCIANKPEDVLKNILDTKQSQVEKIRNAKDYLITTIKESIPTHYKSSLPSFHIAQGTDHIYSEVERLLENATSTVYIVSTINDLAKMYHTDIPEKIKICERNGAKVCLLTHLSNKNHLPFVKRFGASETRIGNLSSKGRMIVEKGKQMIMSDVVWEDSDAQNVQYDYAICTDSNEIVNNIFTLCSFLWNNGRSLKKRKLSIKN